MGSGETAVGRTLAALRRPGAWLRTVLALAGTAKLIVSIPWIFGVSPLWDGSRLAAETHLTRDGAIGLVVGLLALAVARSTRLAYFALPVLCILSVLQVVAYLSDRAASEVSAGFESIHLLTLAICMTVARLAFPGRRSSADKSPMTLV
jgi:hypothetical protein